MRIYAKDEGARRPGAVFTMHVAPGADPDGADGPVEWFNEDGTAVTFGVAFRSGVAEVPDALGRFLLVKGQAKRTPLILPFAA